MKYILLLLSLIVLIYEYNENLKKTKDKKTFIVILGMVFIANLYTFFLKYLGDYSLIQVFSKVSKIIMPGYIEFMKP